MHKDIKRSSPIIVSSAISILGGNIALASVSAVKVKPVLYLLLRIVAVSYTHLTLPTICSV